MPKLQFFIKMPLFQYILEPVSFQEDNKFCIPNYFQKVGYYSGFYSSLRDQKRRNGEFFKNGLGFQCVLTIWRKHEYTCISESNFQTIAISSFLIVQRAVKSRIIANLLKIIRNTSFFVFLKWKKFKYLLEKGHFGWKWQVWQTLGANGRGQNSLK